MGKDKRGGPAKRARAEAQAEDGCGGQGQALGNSQGTLEKGAGSGKDNALKWSSESAPCQMSHFVNRR